MPFDGLLQLSPRIKSNRSLSASSGVGTFSVYHIRIIHHPFYALLEDIEYLIDLLVCRAITSVLITENPIQYAFLINILGMELIVFLCPRLHNFFLKERILCLKKPRNLSLSPSIINQFLYFFVEFIGNYAGNLVVSCLCIYLSDYII